MVKKIQLPDNIYLLAEKAPSIFTHLASKRIGQYDARIAQLRLDYKIADTEKNLTALITIKEEADETKEYRRLYVELLEKIEPPDSQSTDISCEGNGEQTTHLGKPIGNAARTDTYTNDKPGEK